MRHVYHHNLRRWLPVLVGCLVLAAALSVWHRLRVYEQAQIDQVTAATAAGVGVEITARLEARFQALERMAERWAEHGRPSEAAWMYDGGLNVRDYAGFQAIEWVDPQFVVRWVVPRAGNEAVINANLSGEARRRVALEHARDVGAITVTRPVNLLQGGSGFLAYMPIVRGNTFDGFVLGVFRTDAVLGDVLNERVAPGYGIAVYDGTEVIYQRGAATNNSHARPQATTVDLPGTTWRVQVWPHAELLADERFMLPDVILGGGVVTAMLCSMALHFAQTAHARTGDVKRINQRLEREIAQHQHAEAAFRASDAELRAVFAAMTDVVLVLDRNGRYCKIAPTNPALLFRVPDELIGRTLHDVFPQAQADLFLDAVRRATDTQETVNIEYCLPVNGATVWFVGTVSHMGDDAVVMVARDISERKRAETRLRNLYNLMAAWHLSLDDKIARLLDLGRQEFGLDNGLLAQVVDDQYTITHAVSTGAAVEVGTVFHLHDMYCSDVIRSNGPVALDHVAATPAHERACYGLFKLEAYVGTPVSVAGEGYGVLSFSGAQPRTTPFTAADVEFVKLMANWLGGEMKRNQAEAALRSKTSEQEAFIYSIAHDLRAPLVSLQGLASMLREDYGDQLDRTATMYVDRIGANVEKLHTLMNDLLHLLQVGRIEDELACVDLQDVVRHVLEQLDHTLHARGAQVHINGSLPTIRANRTRMIQVFTNLIDNAVKYTPVDRAPLVQIAAADGRNGWEICVRDNGVGIPPALQAKVFGIFQRLPAGKALNPGGSGVGLAIVSRIVETHGGKLWIESEEGVGTTFHLVLPKRAAPAQAAAGAKEQEAVEEHA